MLATRIIPTLLQCGTTLVKGKQFNSWRSVGHALQAIRIHQARGVDELIFLDIAATPEGRGPDFKMVEQLTHDCFCPITVGGGVRSIDDVHGLLESGADKVAIGTAAMENPRLLADIASRFGNQVLVVAIDVMNGHVAIECGAHDTTCDPRELAMSCEVDGAGEILLTSIDREGTMQGYDLELIRDVSQAVDIPVIAHGGCSGYEDMHDAIKAGASAVAAGALFQFTDCTPRGAAEYLKSKGVEVRL